MDESAMAGYLEGHRRRADAKRRARLARHEQALTQAELMIVTLADNYPITRAWLFGSLLQPRWFLQTSDIDIACEGLPQELYLDAYGMLEACGDIPFDLVTIETCPASLTRRVQQEGRLFYVRA